MKAQKWTEDETLFLIRNYPNSSLSIISKGLPNRTYNAIKRMAHILKIKRLVKPNKKSDVSILLDNSPESLYWLGFIVADGSFINRKRLKVLIHKKDRDHLEKLAEYLSTYVRERENYVYIDCQDQWVVESIMNRFKLGPSKTYGTMDISTLNSKEAFISFFVGVVDGDGYIGSYSFFSKSENRMRKIKNLTLSAHSNWLRIFKEYEKLLFIYFGLEYTGTRVQRVRGRDIVRLSFRDQIILNSIKSYCKNLNLPLLYRKWKNV